MKTFTDKLVYIPYFILGEIDPDNQDAVKGMEHFCTTPGVINADKVIVQSEDMKKIYVNVLTDFMKEHTGEDTRKCWEEKILGLGSPKLDKVANTRKEDVKVPEEWLKVIEKADGSWKKIIFYNTSVQALLDHNEKMIAKIRDVLQVFKENQEEVALLWRPHPLIEATIKSMRPRDWEEYEEIVDTYKAEGWGIYDDTVELDRAIALSDAYYGDGSSVVKLCQEARKPVMIQDMEKRNGLFEKDFRTLWFDGAHLEGNELWFSAGNFNALVRANMCTGETKVVGIFPSDSLNQVHLYRQVLKVENQLIFIPAHARHITVYNMEEGLFKTFRIGGKEEADFYSAIYYQDYVWLFGIHGKNILSFHITTGKIEKHQLKEVSEISGFVPEPMLEGGRCYIPVKNSNQILELFTDTGLVQLHSVGEESCRYNGIVSKEKEKLLITTDGKLVCWKKNEGILWKKSLLYEDGGIIENIRFGKWNNYIWILPKMQRDEMVVYDYMSEKIVSIKMHYAEKKAISLCPGKCTAPLCWGGKLYVYCFTDEMLHILDIKSGADHRMWIGLEKDEIQKIWKEQMEESKGIVFENQLYVRRSLNNYISLVKENKNASKNGRDYLEMEGEKIYNDIKRCCD